MFDGFIVIDEPINICRVGAVAVAVRQQQSRRQPPSGGQRFVLHCRSVGWWSRSRRRSRRQRRSQCHSQKWLGQAAWAVIYPSRWTGMWYSRAGRLGTCPIVRPDSWLCLGLRLPIRWCLWCSDYCWVLLAASGVSHSRQQLLHYHIRRCCDKLRQQWSGRRRHVRWSPFSWPARLTPIHAVWGPEDDYERLG